jgi:hypothetical protein
MKFLKSIIVGFAAFIATAIAANVANIIYAHIHYRNMPDVTVGWSPMVWQDIRESQFFWVIALFISLAACYWESRRTAKQS